MIRCSCHGLHGCVPVAPSATPRGSASVAELLPPLAEQRRGVGERVAAAGADLDLGGDQLADEVRLELRSQRGFLELLEAVDEAERLGVEERELLLDGDREVGDGVERLARAREHLLVADPLLLAHARKPNLGALSARNERQLAVEGAAPAAGGRRPGSTGSHSVKTR